MDGVKRGVDAFHHGQTLLLPESGITTTTMPEKVAAEKIDRLAFHMYDKLVCLVDDARSTTSASLAPGDPEDDGLGKVDKWASPLNSLSTTPVTEPDLGRDSSISNPRTQPFSVVTSINSGRYPPPHQQWTSSNSWWCYECRSCKKDPPWFIVFPNRLARLKRPLTHQMQYLLNPGRSPSPSTGTRCIGLSVLWLERTNKGYPCFVPYTLC